MERYLSYTETQKRLVICESLLGTQAYTEMQCLLICPLRPVAYARFPPQKQRKLWLLGATNGN